MLYTQPFAVIRSNVFHAPLFSMQEVHGIRLAAGRRGDPSLINAAPSSG